MSFARAEAASIPPMASRTAPSRSQRSAQRGRISLAAFVPILGFVVLYWAVATTHPLPAWLPLAYLALSLLTAVVYAVDKSAARAARHRVSERALLLLGLLGGWPGAIVAQQVLRHKTSKRSFRRVFWVTVVIHVLVFVLVATELFLKLA